MSETLKGKRILCHSDSALAQTGFGTVSKHILTAFHKAGMQIHHLAINFHGDFVDQKVIPWQQQPARLLDPSDPHGIGMFLKAVETGQYDYIWVCNDLYVTQAVTSNYLKVIDSLKEQGLKIPILLYYYPVDCRVPRGSASFVEVADLPVCYNQYGFNETIKTYPQLKDKLQIMPHGVDTTTFYPLDKKKRAEIRKEVLGVDDNTCVVIQVNRNNTRKQIPYSFLAFKKFRELVPNSIYYCHMAVVDQGGDLRFPLDHLGLSPKKDVIFPLNYSSKTPVPTILLNKLYNMGDIFLSCSAGEGFGLGQIEAMAAGVPVVLPDNTSIPEMVGIDRGYTYKCNNEVYFDPSGFRKVGLVPDIVAKMNEAWKATPLEKEALKIRARDWAVTHDWKVITPTWLPLFEKAQRIHQSRNNLTQEV